MLPELLTRQLEKTNTAVKKPIVQVRDSLKRTYCYCKTTVAKVDMVGCDMCDDWFHPNCLNLKKLLTFKV